MRAKFILSLIHSITFIIIIFQRLISFPPADSAFRFTHHPPSVLYVQTGQTARFVWNYTVDNKNLEFSLNTPEWGFYGSNNRRVVIGFDDGLYGWKWVISRQCPARLLNPTRVRKESTATLVISNVTTADEGRYECMVVLTTAPYPLSSKVQLTVTVRSKFKIQPPPTKRITEGQELTLSCAAVGPPTPNITWVHVGDKLILSTGTGSATLRIPNIRIDQDGTYQCQAWNNPNERPVMAETVVTVFRYKPRFTHTPPSVVNVTAGHTVRLVWNYTVRNRELEFSIQSPMWVFQDPMTGKGLVIGTDDGFANWDFVINNISCPTRLLHPTLRVSREPPATLVIKNVITTDSGTYKCRMVFKAANPITSSVRLIVKDQLPHFTKVPPTIMYLSEGDSAKLEWDYVVNNKSSEFALSSPSWTYHDPTNGWETIGYDDGTSGWQWKISHKCPSRLLSPIRVSKLSTASLVIFNVSRYDSGKYSCNLVMKDRPAITSLVELVVTASPVFTNYVPNVVSIVQGDTLSIHCSAIGPPTPNITWFKIIDSTKLIESHGKGNSTITIRNISTEHEGFFECHAKNNPDRPAVTRKTNIVVMSKPSFNYFISDTTVPSLLGFDQRLICGVNGNPIPFVTWYDPKGRQVFHNVTSFQWYSEITLRINDVKDFGVYRCRASNSLGISEHNISIISKALGVSEQVSQDHRCYSQTTIIICVVIILVLFVFNLIWLIAACKRSYQNISNGEKNRRKSEMSSKKDAAGESYENDFELEDNIASLVTVPHALHPIPTGPEYEFIPSIENANPDISHCINDTSNYQGLGVTTGASIQGPVYEPLRTRTDESSMQHSNNGQHPYEPLNIRKQNTTYQSLKNGKESERCA